MTGLLGPPGRKRIRHADQQGLLQPADQRDPLASKGKKCQKKNKNKTNEDKSKNPKRPTHTAAASEAYQAYPASIGSNAAPNSPSAGLSASSHCAFVDL